jgi:hypothetical protein
MDQDLVGGLGSISLLLAAAACFSVIFLCFCAISRQLSYVLWATMLAAVAASLLQWPHRATPILAAGIAVSSLLVLVSGIQARRAGAALQQEMTKLNDAVAALQGRLVLRLGTPGQPASSLLPTEIDPSGNAPPELDVVAAEAENSP